MDIFDIIGPVMIGPSSSHTAGAARIGRVARKLLGEEPVRAEIGLCGSFASTYHGHGTDRALIAGLLDMDVDDMRLRDSLEIANARGLSYSFAPLELKNAHPNTARLTVTGETGAHVTLTAASVGGGAIRVVALDGLDVSFTGAANTLIISHTDEPGMIASVTGLLAGQSVNIATMQVFRRSVGGQAVMVLETDGLPSATCLDCLRNLRDIHRITMLEKLF